MSASKRSTLQTAYGSSGTQFPDNTSGDITPAIERAFGQDLTDSHFNLIDDKYTGAAGIFLNGITDTTSLKTLVTVGVTLNIIVFYVDATLGIRQYQLVSATTAEKLPYIVRPSDYDGTTNHKIWKLLPINGKHEIIVDIGDWNMDSTTSVTIALPSGIDYSQVRTVEVSIRQDLIGGTYYTLTPLMAMQGGLNGGGYILNYLNAGTIILSRETGGVFDSTNYDDTSYNRGWIIITFIP